jgi:hypothetical protein
MIFSTILWADLQEKLCEILNIYPASLYAQYRLSTDAKASLPFGLTGAAAHKNDSAFGGPSLSGQ